MSSNTEIGSINRCNQQNMGETGEPGTDHMQKFYLMKCLNCGYEYKANGSDIWERKCPKCGKGKP